MAMMNRADEVAAIRLAREGDGQAIETLIRSHQEALYAFMLRMSGRPDVAEDIVQEAFVRVLKNLDRFDTNFRFSTWLFTIAKRLYVNHLQKQRPVYDSETVGSQVGRGHTPGALSADAETQRNLRDVLDAALAGLGSQQREIILLFHQHNWPITEIALHLDMPEGTVKSHLHRARKRMKRFIESNPRMHEQAQEVWT
jgi:RNA polymerase sigma-70 factor, ECF subfamily